MSEPWEGTVADCEKSEGPQADGLYVPPHLAIELSANLTVRVWQYI